MEALTKRIVAILLIAGIGTGIGIGAFYFLATPAAIPWETPGAPAGATNLIKIGVLNDIGEIQGDHAYEGTWLAAYNINTAGGVDINGTTYYIAVIAEDTEEAAPLLDVTKGVAAAQKIIHVDGAEFLIGGFRTEAVKSYIEVVMDNKIIFLGTGAATDYFCENVVDSYSRYQYFFRTNPHNSTAMGGQIIKTLIYLAWLGVPMQAYVQGIGADPADPYYNTTSPGILGITPLVHRQLNITQVAILREDLDWTIPFASAIIDNLPPFFNMTEIKYPITATSEDFTGYINTLQGLGVQIVIPLISAQGGIKMMTQYAALEPGFLIAGVDVQAQTSEYWTDTLTGCAYEVYSHGFAGLNNTNVTPLTQAYYDQYWDVWGHAPLYTGTGSYDAVYTLVNSIEVTQSLTAKTIITQMETYDRGNPRVNTSVTAQYASTTTLAEGFTGAHDVVADWPYGTIAYGQWQPDGKQYCISTGEGTLLDIVLGLSIYPDSVVTGTMLLPPWGINGLYNLP